MAKKAVKEVDNENLGGVVEGVANVPRRNGPGRVEVGGRLVLHSGPAIELFTGRRIDKKAQGYMGLLGFAKSMMRVWTAARANDPFADFLLVRLEEEYQEMVSVVALRQQQVSSMLESMDGIAMDQSVSVSPVQMELRFVCPWAYRAAALLYRYDRMVMDALTCRRVGLLFGDDWFEVVVRPAGQIRRWFTLSSRWINTGATRENIKAQDAVSARALEMYQQKKFTDMLELPEKILNGQKRASVSPVIMVSKV